MITIKNSEEIAIMAEGGAKLARVKNALKEAVGVGVKASEIEELANELIDKEGGKASFKMVSGYSWATCVNVNEDLVHGIPGSNVAFKKGDLVSVDVGLFYKGFHTDTSISVGLFPDSDMEKFLNVGQEALNKAISKLAPGKHIFEISEAIEETVRKGGFTPIKALVGHGIGRELHEDPQIPCFVPGRIEDSPEIKVGMALAIEVMYAQGDDKVEVLPDGWTIAMRDGKISGLFEETVAVTREGTKVLTR